MANEKKVLVVDDDPGCRELLVAMARAMGYSVSEAADGLTAVDQACARPPDLILMDLLMPRMDGCQATATLKTKLPTKNIPIVVCTALSEGPQTKSALEAGAAEILQKPITLANIRAALQRYAPLSAQI
jgi:CheY-like chemotaxis protein